MSKQPAKSPPTPAVADATPAANPTPAVADAAPAANPTPAGPSQPHPFATTAPPSRPGVRWRCRVHFVRERLSEYAQAKVPPDFVQARPGDLFPVSADTEWMEDFGQAFTLLKLRRRG